MEKIEYNGCVIDVYYDDYAENPREYDANCATFVCEHRRYNLGDEHDVERAVNELFEKYVTSRQVIDYFVEERKAVLKENACYNPNPNIGGLSQYTHYYEWDGSDYAIGYDSTAEGGEDETAAEMADDLSVGEKLELVELTGEVFWLPISMYEHGGVALWLGSTRGHYDAMWDCGTIGFAYMERETAEKNLNIQLYGTWQKAAEHCMEGEMKEYNAYVQGQCFGYVAYDEDGDEIGSGCGGYLGDDGYDEMLETAKADIDYFVEHKNEETCTI